MHYDVELYEALKTSLISMDSTMRSNLGVGLPIDVLVVRSDVCEADLNHRIEAGEPYFHDLRSRWSAALRAAHQNIPRPPYKARNRTKNLKKRQEARMAEANNKIAVVTGAGYRRRARGVAGADERRLHGGAGRAADRKAGGDQQARRGHRQEPAGIRRHGRSRFDRRAVRQGDGGLRPARRALQQCRHGRAAGAVRGSQRWRSGRRWSQPTSPRRFCAPSTRSGS